MAANYKGYDAYCFCNASIAITSHVKKTTKNNPFSEARLKRVYVDVFLFWEETKRATIHNKRATIHNKRATVNNGMIHNTNSVSCVSVRLKRYAR